MEWARTGEDCGRSGRDQAGVRVRRGAKVTGNRDRRMDGGTEGRRERRREIGREGGRDGERSEMRGEGARGSVERNGGGVNVRGRE